VPYTVRDDVVLNSLTVKSASDSGPYTSRFPAGATNILTTGEAGALYDEGGAEINLAGPKYRAIGTWDPVAGTGDCTAAFQQALNDAGALNGGKVKLAAGIYRVLSTLTPLAQTHIEGAGQQLTTIRKEFDTTDLFSISVNYLKFSHFTVNSTRTPAQHTGGSVFHFIPNSNTNFKFVDIDINNVFRGFDIDNDNTGFVWLDHVYFFNIKDRGIRMTRSNANGNHWWTDVGMSNQFYTAPANSVGIEILSGSQIQMKNINITFFGLAGIWINSAANQIVGQIWMDGVTVSQTLTGPGIRINDGSGLANAQGGYLFFLTNVWSAYNGGANGHGIWLQKTEGVYLTSCRSQSNGLHGLLIDTGATKVKVVGGHYASNSNTTYGGIINTTDGIHVTAAVSNFSIQGISSGSLGGSLMQRWGVFIEAGASNTYVVEDNDLTGNQTGTLSDGGTGTQKRLKDNLGYNPRGAAIGVIAVPATGVGYTNNTGVALTFYIWGLGSLTAVTLFTPGSGGTGLGVPTQFHLEPEASFTYTYAGAAPTHVAYGD
jgi:hypothetical protein